MIEEDDDEFYEKSEQQEWFEDDCQERTSDMNEEFKRMSYEFNN